MPVLYVPNGKGPKNRTTELYFDTLSKTDFSDCSLVLADNLKLDLLKGLKDCFGDLDIMFLHFLAWSGALLNSCDNTFHSDLKRRYSLSRTAVITLI
jgi:hypothetical protein